jgi:hypothetical protein
VTLRIGDQQITRKVDSDDQEVTIELPLKRGKTTLEGIFETADGERYGTYYAIVRRK